MSSYVMLGDISVDKDRWLLIFACNEFLALNLP